MENGSHSRTSYPFDKMVPKMRGAFYDSNVRQAEKKMHKKKQRQHNLKLTNDSSYSD